MWNNIRIVIGVITFLMLIGCNYKQQESNTIELDSIQKQNSQKEQIKAQGLDNTREQSDLLQSEYIIDSIFRRVGDYPPSRFLIPRCIMTLNETKLLKSHYNQNKSFTTVDNFTYINNRLLLRSVDLVAARKNNGIIDRAYTGKYLGFSMPYYKNWLTNEEWDAANSIIESFGWVYFNDSEQAASTNLVGQSEMLPITINEKVKELLKQGVLSCYYENDKIVLFEYFDRLFDPSSDSTFYFEFLVQEPYLYIQKVPNLVATFGPEHEQSSLKKTSKFTNRKGLLYKNKELIATIDPKEVLFNTDISKEDNIEAQLLITEYYEPLIDFIQETNKQYK